MSIPTLKYYRTHDNVIPPEAGTEEAACYDLHSHLYHVEKFDDTSPKSVCTAPREVTLFTPKNEVIIVKPECTFKGYHGSESEYTVTIPAHHRAIVPTGIIFDIPKGYSVRLHPRSGLSIKKAFIVANCEGVIDSDYFHEIKALMVNNSDEDIVVEHGDRICQAEIVKCIEHTIEETFDEPQQRTNRVGGLGSTGVKTS
jgi:dUTP pyrophosphatase